MTTTPSRAPVARRSRAALLIPAVLGGAVALVLAGAGPAAAHAKVTGTDPADGAVLAAVPATITITFDEAMLPDGQGMVATTPSGAKITLAAKIVGVTLTAPGPADAGPGAYSLAWRAVSDDGHALTGTLGFTVKAATSPAATTSQAPEQSPTPTVPTSAPSAVPVANEGSTSPPWTLLLGAGALALVVVAAVIVSRRRGPTL